MAAQSDTTVAEFIRYNNWANRQVLDACRQLSEDQLSATIPGAFGTIRDTLQHIIRAEAGYLRLLIGERPEPTFDWEDKPDLVALTAYAAQVGEGLEHAANRVDLSQVIHQERQGEKRQYQALALFIQIINHGIEHRTNITTMLNQAQHEVPHVSGWGYLWAHPERFELQIEV